jgi:hypothetical protein
MLLTEESLSTSLFIAVEERDFDKLKSRLAVVTTVTGFQSCSVASKFRF